MEKIFLDTSFLFAYYNADDEDHELALDLIKDMVNNKVDIIISDYIFDELITLLLYRISKAKAIEICNRLINEIKSRNIELKYVDNEIFMEALKIFIRFSDKEWSFTDCTSYVIIKNAKITKAVSFDEHFRQFGIEILPLENS
ncbi:MAG: uncharacterized protein QG641_596 [Candidatus Poribacteria bacterium]|nr:uncharacterized protein [Candidatus Poribacteria bacterium]